MIVPITMNKRINDFPSSLLKKKQHVPTAYNLFYDHEKEQYHDDASGGFKKDWTEMDGNERRRKETVYTRS
jgi:hypothetical protein